MNWTKSIPTEPGFYWCHRLNFTRMVSVFNYGPHCTTADFFTNEDGGAPLSDASLYGGALWYGPIEPPSIKDYTDTTTMHKIYGIV